MDKVLELNNTLDEEIKFCEEFEELLLKKKELLIHSKAFELKIYDEKILEAKKRLQILNENRIRISKMFNVNNPSLSEIIKDINNKTAAIELENKRKKLKIFGEKIDVINRVINSLIEHSLKLIDGNIMSIANAMTATQTKGDYYNNQGTKAEQQIAPLSAIIEDA